MSDQFEFAISVGQLNSAAAYLDSSKEPQQLIAPADGSSWLANDVLLEPDCVAAEFSPDAGYVDFNAYLGDVEAHTLALSDFPNRAIHAIPLRDSAGFGTLSSAADETDFDVMVERVRHTELKESGLPANFKISGRRDTARLLHLAILFRAYRSIARRTLLRPCSSAVIAIPRYMWGAASAAAEITGIENYFLVDPNVASIAARLHEDARQRTAVSRPIDLGAMARRTTLVMEIKYSSLAVSVYRPGNAHSWTAKRLQLCQAPPGGLSHPDETGDMPSKLLEIVRREVSNLLGDDEDVQFNLHAVLRYIRGRVEGGASTTFPRYVAVLGERRQGMLNVGSVLRAAKERGYSNTTPFRTALQQAGLRSTDIQDIILTGPLRNVAIDTGFSPAEMVKVWLQQADRDLFERTGPIHAGAVSLKVGGAPSLGCAVLSRFSTKILENAISPDLGVSGAADASGANKVVAGRPGHEIIEIVTAMMKAVGEVHFSTGAR